MAFQCGFYFHFSLCEHDHLSKTFLKSVCKLSPVNHISIFFAIFHYEPLVPPPRAFCFWGGAQWFVCGGTSCLSFANTAIVMLLKNSNHFGVLKFELSLERVVSNFVP